MKNRKCLQVKKEAVNNNDKQNDKIAEAPQGQFGFVPNQGQSGKRTFRYVESSELAKGCKLCKY